MKKALINCKLVDVEIGKTYDGQTIVWENGKITSVGKDIKLTVDTEVINCQGKYVTPGLINANTNLGLKETGLRWEGNDENENSNSQAAALSVIDGINPFDEGFQNAQKSGITTSHVLTGQNSVISGQSAIIKNTGTIIDEMIIKRNHGLVMTLGEFPKNMNNSKRQFPITRMGIAAFIRKRLSQARYTNDSKNNDSVENQVLRRALNKEMPVFIRAHRLDDIVTAVRIKKEFGLKMILVHGTEAYQAPELLKEHSIPIITGPFYLPKSRKEIENLHPSSVSKLYKAGLQLAIATPTDHLLPMEGSLAVREGLPRNNALYSITLGAAKILDVSDKIGSIEVGKTADIVVWDGKPLELMSSVNQTIIEGQTVYQKEVNNQ